MERVSDEKYINALNSLLQQNELDINISTIDLKMKLKEKHVLINDQIIKQVCSALNAGLHIIFTGPPGTGKTTLAQCICEVALEKGYSTGTGLFTTATADWTTFDTIGGYMPEPLSEGGSKLKFFEGHFLEAISKKEWLVIDELNRADIDKAIGPLFTVLSKKSVELPYFYECDESTGSKSKRVKIDYNNESSKYSMSSNWRIIATMNSFDKMSLYRISYAFLRRFACIYVGLPDEYEKYLRDNTCTLPITIQNSLVDIIVNISSIREIGPSLFLDMLRYIKKHGEYATALCEAVNIFLIPQIEGLEDESFLKVVNSIKEAVSIFASVDTDKSLLTYKLEYKLLNSANKVTENNEEKVDENVNVPQN